MTLGQAQEEFATALTELLLEIRLRGDKVRIGEVYRAPETAQLYAEQGRGIANSNHCKKLAADLFIIREGYDIWEIAVYREYGEFWKTTHSLARWGGDFPTKDGVHFSFEWQGVK